jgi:S-DNA-T family DNA segregation ATPase FtsK/SpoIIIE
MPHLLIAGSTGSGKSVGINMIISSLLYSKDPLEVKLAMIDPKKIELSFYKRLRKHFLAVCPDLDEEIITAPQNAVLLLKSIEMEMEKRYDKLAKAGVRNIVDYNIKVSEPERRPKDTDEMKHHPIPYIIVIVDELADLMITAGKDVEEPITRLAQLARAVGIHLVLATQRPSVNVITGVIKANFSARIAYQVATKVDSRTILDMNGAEQLLGKGDMLFLPTGSPKPIRIQNAFISTDEVEKITNFIYSQQGYSKPYYLPSIYEKKKGTSGGFLADLDPMFEDAARVIVRHQQGSVSLLQRRLKLGYSRAARIVDQLEEAGIVGPNDGSKARTVIVENEEQLETILRNL